MTIHTPDRTLALAGIMQTSALVNHIARGRWSDPGAFTTSLNSIFIMEPTNTLNVYGDHIINVQFGLRRLTSFFPKPDKQHDSELASYLFGTILLAKILQSDKQRLENLVNAITQLDKQRQTLVLNEDQLTERLAQIYMDHVSTLKRRIHILGNREILKQPQEVNRIRALLLAGIRSAILWQQVGGRLWHLWWKRQMIANQARDLLNMAMVH